MKTLFILIIVAVVGYVGWQAIQTKPDPAVPQAIVTDTTGTNQPAPDVDASRVRAVDNENIRIAFRGFGPGKEHTGTVPVQSGTLALTETGSMQGRIVANVAGLTSDNAKLTDHLKSKDFFDTSKYPTATFDLTSISNGKATGSLTVKGNTKSISFPVQILESNPEQYSAKFTINMQEFGINQTFANETVELSVLIPLK